MLPVVSVTFGNKIYIIKGGVLRPANFMLETDINSTGPYAGYKPHGTAGADYYTMIWGGDNSHFPEAYANHKPAAWYYGWLYQHGVSADLNGGELCITKWDGSGIYKQGGSTFYNVAWRNGRGTRLISPSGTSANYASMKANDLCWVQHNGVLFAVGSFPYQAMNAATDPWIKKHNWYSRTPSPTTESSTNIKNRAYGALYMHHKPLINKTIKGIIPLKKYKPFAKYHQWLQGCDAISHENDIYYANWVDVVRYPGGSGTPQIVETASGIYPTAKCFCEFPASGFAAGVAVGGSTLFMLTGSGALKTIGTSDHKVRTIYNLAWKCNDVRATHCMARIESATAEPGRAPLLIKFDNKLDAFITSATSGYRHFQCDGNPASGSSWTDKTESLPYNVRAHDGNMFGYVCYKENKLYVAHISMSEVGMCGYQGANKAAGGISIYERGVSSDTWTCVHQTFPGEVSRGLIPYNNIGPQVAVPSGIDATVYTASDYAIIQYYVLDHYKRPVDVTIEYSLDGGSSWSTARRFKSYDPTVGSLGDAITNLSSSPTGTLHTFYWDYVNDVGYGVAETCKLRIIPTLTR